MFAEISPQIKVNRQSGAIDKPAIRIKEKYHSISRLFCSFVSDNPLYYYIYLYIHIIKTPTLGPYSRTSYDISQASDWLRWPSRPIRSLRYIVTFTRKRARNNTHVPRLGIPILIGKKTDIKNLTLQATKPWRPKGFCQYEIIINVLISSFRFIWISVLWVYGHLKYFPFIGKLSKV